MGLKRKKSSVLGEAMYEVNFIKARRLVKGQPEYLIKWKGFDDDKYDTWEGLANLSGLEPDLATFEAQQKRDQEDYVKKPEKDFPPARPVLARSPRGGPTMGRPAEWRPELVELADDSVSSTDATIPSSL